MNFEIRSMSEAEAEQIIAWRYPGELSFYDMERDVEDMAELRAAHVREEKYFSVFSGDELIGFYEFTKHDDGIEIGLGLRPDLTGQGRGRSFLEAGLNFAKETYKPLRFKLRVAAFNGRAIKLYEEAGFVRDMVYMHDFYGTPYEFVLMSRPALTADPPSAS